MKLDSKKFEGWLKSKDYYLPGLSQLCDNSGANILLIGASVFELYQLQDWIPALERKTGDFDLSVGLVGDDSFYAKTKDILLKLNYRIDDDHTYRFHPENKIQDGLQYIDLLAHPLDEKTSQNVAREAMGVGADFSLNSFLFASRHAFLLEKNIHFPNPIGMLALKMEAYIDEPNKRIKDFADILELTSGLVKKGQHFELEDLWGKLKVEPEALMVKANLQKITNENTAWDLEDVRTEMNKRLYKDSFLDGELLNLIKDCVTVGLA